MMYRNRRLSGSTPAILMKYSQTERERLDKQHAVLQMIFDGRLIFPPIENPQNILDCGYGSGAWAVDVAEKYPECRVCSSDRGTIEFL
jgi:ubiquinone/menaquinone biosynthesis C-methylase UbiE